LALANARQHEYATLEHLLMALTDDEDAAPALAACGVEVDRLRANLNDFLDHELTSLAVEGVVDAKPTAGVQRVIQRAAIHVQSSGRSEVAGANVLVALFSERESHAVFFLQEQNMSRLDAVNYISYGIAKRAGTSRQRRGRAMAGKTIVTCAVTGSITRPEQHPGLPITPAQIAEAAVDAAKAGAAIAHIHVRDPETGAPSMAIELYREVVERIRSSGTDLIINLTTGPGGRFIPSDDDPKVAAPGSSLMRPEQRVEHVLALRPEICSLDLNTMWFGSSVVINTPDSVRVMAEAIQSAGVRPELEVFDSGDIQLAQELLERGVLERPPLFQVVLGIRNGFPATPATLLYAKSLLPEDAIWAAMGIGRMEFPIVAQACLLGGHVRVGLEDNLYLSKGELAPSNAALVERAVTLVELLGGSVATAAEAREMLSLAAG
jgi:uncharacterized protein (DUF849 family)